MLGGMQPQPDPAVALLQATVFELQFLHCETWPMANAPFASVVPGLGEITGDGPGTHWMPGEKGGITIIACTCGRW